MLFGFPGEAAHMGPSGVPEEDPLVGYREVMHSKHQNASFAAL